MTCHFVVTLFVQLRWHTEVIQLRAGFSDDFETIWRGRDFSEVADREESHFELN